MHTDTYREVVRMILTCSFPLSTTGIAFLAHNSLAEVGGRKVQVSEMTCLWTKTLSNDNMEE